MDAIALLRVEVLDDVCSCGEKEEISTWSANEGVAVSSTIEGVVAETTAEMIATCA